MERKEIYLVDDSADHRLVVRTIFKQFLPNYHVRFFQGAQELYQFMILQSAPDFKGRRPGLVLLDLMMPAINGYDLLKLIRRTPDNHETSWAGIPVVILTNTTAEDQIRKCYQAGANSFIIKPVDFDELRLLLEHVCHYWIDFNVLPIAKPPLKEEA